MNFQNIAQEEWVPRKPLKDLPIKYYIDAIEVIAGQLTIFLRPEIEPYTVSLEFNNNFHMYKATEEIASIDLLYDILGKYGDDFIYSSRFFIIHNSSYISWLKQQSGGLLQADTLQHYFILGITSIVDVIAYQEPKVTITYDNPELSKD